MNNMLKIIFPAKWESLAIANDIFNAIADNVTSNQRKIYHIRTILSEAFNNAYLYGDNKSEDSFITVEVCFNSDKFFASILNKGSGFADNRTSWDKFPSGETESGRGIKIIKQLCNKVEFKKTDAENFGIYMEISINDDKKIKCK